jgi:VCBS repeat-containing protein
LKSIAGGIEIKLPHAQRPTDKEIAATAANQINLSSTMPKGTVGVTVHGGWITLQGEVEWHYQKTYAENAVEHLAGVKGVFNQIMIKSTLTSAQVETAIISAFGQNAPLVEAAGNKGVLCGKVQSYAE